MIRYIEKQSDNARVRMLGYVRNCTQEYIYMFFLENKTWKYDWLLVLSITSFENIFLIIFTLFWEIIIRNNYTIVENDGTWSTIELFLRNKK